MRAGHTVAGRKPIESGVDGSSPTDGGQLEAAGTVPASSSPPYLFADPVSPHLAARRSGQAVDVRVAASWCRASSEGAKHLVVETAGGLFSPLGRDVRNLDLVAELAPDDVLLVAADRLGVLHDLAAVREGTPPELWARSLVVLAAPSMADASTGSNGAEALWLGLTARVGPWVWGAGVGEAGVVLALLEPPVVGPRFT